MLAIEKKALEDFQDMMNVVESDLSYGFEKIFMVKYLSQNPTVG